MTHAGAQVPVDEVHAIQTAFRGLPVDGDGVLSGKELDDAALDLRLLRHRDDILPVETEVHPRLEVSRAQHDLLSDLERLHVQEGRDGHVVLPPEVAVVELREPGIAPVEPDDLFATEIAEVVDRQAAVVEDEADRRRRPGHRSRQADGHPARPTLQRIADSCEDHQLGLLLVDDGQGLAGYVVALDTGAGLHLLDVPREGRASVRANEKVFLEETRESSGQGLGIATHALVERVRKKVREGLQVGDPDLQLQAHVIVLDEDLGDGGGRHRPRDHERVRTDHDRQ